MKSINEQNIDEIMFQLLEGEITGKEREQLLIAIESDPIYNSIWKAWQHTVLTPDTSIQAINTERFKKKSNKIVPLIMRYSIAAMLVLCIGLGLYFGLKTSNQSPLILESSNLKTLKKEIPHIKHKSNNNLNTVRDTVVPLKEKIKHIAYSSPSKRRDQITNKVGNIKVHLIPDSLIKSEIVKKPITNEILVLNNPSPPKEGTILVSIEIDNSKALANMNNKSKKTLLEKFFGISKIKIVDDENTRTQKKIIIENKKYQIIAGF